jgi:phosphatidylglycerol:prolipoprotein diacylglycerol transferase
MLPFPNIDPIAFELGPFAVRWYGLAYVTGICIAWWLLRSRARKNSSEWSLVQVDDLIFYAALGVVLGGRIGYVLFYNLPTYLSDPSAILKVWQGGMSFHGGLLGCWFAMWLFARKTEKSWLGVGDFLAPVVPIGLFLGRIANFINSELWGEPTGLAWGVVFPDPAAGGVPRHPSQLYEAFLEGLVLFAILWMFSRKPRPLGSVSGMAMFWYGCFRFLVEFVRTPDAHLGYLAMDWLTMGQILSAPMIVIGALMIVIGYRRAGSQVAKA